MMTEREYENLWEGIYRLNKQMKIPSYYQYLQREVYFQDYLDLFSTNDVLKITFPRKEIGGFQTVFLPQLQLQPDPNGKHTVIDHETGFIRLIVDHEYPFSNEDFTKVTTIKYILIGEAAPGGGKYVYKDASGAYVKAPLTAIGVDVDSLGSIPSSNNDGVKSKESKKMSTLRLAEFARNGFILLDLLPFALDFNKYSKLRDGIIQSDNTLVKFYIERLEDLIYKLQKISHNWDFCFVGPETISMAAIKLIEEEKDGVLARKHVSHDDDRLDSDDFIFQKKTGNVVKSNYTRHPSPGGPITHISKRARLTTIIGGSGPHSELIQRVFRL
jgi:hypothetical protein